MADWTCSPQSEIFPGPSLRELIVCRSVPHRCSPVLRYEETQPSQRYTVIGDAARSTLAAGLLDQRFKEGDGRPSPAA
jgi:hypothetical protein